MIKQEFDERMSKCLLTLMELKNEYRTLIVENKNDNERLGQIGTHLDEMERNVYSLREDLQNPSGIMLQDMQ